MIKENKVLININNRNYKIYKDLGYDLKRNTITILEIPIQQVSKNSKIKITAVCDICKKESTIMICKYYSNFERGGYNFYSCFNCKNYKKEITNIEKYGVKSFSQTNEFKKKYKETNLEKYGVDNPNKIKEIRDKIKETNLEKYGVDSYFKTDISKLYNKNWMSSDEFKLKSKKSLLEKYGVDSYSKTDSFKKEMFDNKELIVKKIKQTFLEKYGVDWYSKTDSFKKEMFDIKDSTQRKKEITCINRYGVDNVLKHKDIYKKGYQTKIDNNYIVADEELSEWNLYKRNVKRITNKFKKKLYEEWNGYDYYDNELIKGNLSFGHKHKNYPSIDHKISTLFGFKNNIQPEEIGNIDNLCITKKYINSSKNSLIEELFIKRISNSQ